MARTKEIPFFSEEKLQEILHYTDLEYNPAFLATKANCFYRLYCGAKGVSKSFGRAIETIYRIVNETNFCSCWCRNQYNHITTTLKPMFEKVLSFLADVHHLDYRNFFDIYASGLYWKGNDGGKGRAIYFQNWEKIQAFQGFTLANHNFRFGELVIDEPIEDPLMTKLKGYELTELYETQEKKLPLLIQNTINREASSDNDFNIKKNVSFCYNLFTTKHFVVKNYHNPFLNIINQNQINQKTLNQLLEKSYLQTINKSAFDDFGVCITMYSKFFVPKNQIDEYQIKYFKQLKKSDYRLWMITVAGFAFEEQINQEEYFLKDYILNYDESIKPELIISQEELLTKFDNHQIIYVFDGYDPGKSDKASWVRIGIDQDFKIYVINIVEDLRSKGKIKSREFTKQNLIEHIQLSNLMLNLEDNLREHENLIFCDNDIEIEWINQDLLELNFDGFCLQANRKDTKHEKFGIINRQNWAKMIFAKKLIYFVKGTEKLALNLSQQLITDFEKKQRNEKVNSQIYDLINAFEMACSQAYKIQLLNLNIENETIKY